jgi:hypothetical protein
LHECITGEQRQLNDLPPIAPAMNFADHREKSFDSTLLKLIDHELLVPRAGVNGVPLRLGNEVHPPVARQRFSSLVAAIQKQRASAHN